MVWDHERVMRSEEAGERGSLGMATASHPARVKEELDRWSAVKAVSDERGVGCDCPLSDRDPVRSLTSPSQESVLRCVMSLRCASSPAPPP